MHLSQQTFALYTSHCFFSLCLGYDTFIFNKWCYTCCNKAHSVCSTSWFSFSQVDCWHLTAVHVAPPLLHADWCRIQRIRPPLMEAIPYTWVLIGATPTPPTPIISDKLQQGHFPFSLWPWSDRLLALFCSLVTVHSTVCLVSIISIISSCGLIRTRNTF